MIKKVANETLNYSIALCREKEVKGFIIDFHIRRYLNIHEICTFTVCRVLNAYQGSTNGSKFENIVEFDLSVINIACIMKINFLHKLLPKDRKCNRKNG